VQNDEAWQASQQAQDAPLIRFQGVRGTGINQENTMARRAKRGGRKAKRK
jgi:hypothetical protein